MYLRIKIEGVDTRYGKQVFEFEPNAEDLFSVFYMWHRKERELAERDKEE